MDFAEIRDEEADEALEQRPGCLRGLFRLALILLVPLFAMLALLPTLLSTEAGLKVVLPKVNAALAPVQVSVGQWSLGWLRAPVLKRLRVVDPERGVEFTSDEVAFDRGLLRLLPVGFFDVGQVTFKRPAATITPALKTPQPKTGKAKTKKGFFFLPVVDIAAGLVIAEGRVTVTGFTPETFEAQQAAGTVTLESYKK
ncbi:MAG: hypothetical protein PHV28_15150, partial [Kiritimatiellae bacterium]|nr:hypothetical protein [Kiritimatiellia bacterium]